MVDASSLAEINAACDQALAGNPRDVAVLIKKAEVLNGMGRFQEAAESCDRALALVPESADAHFQRAGAFTGLNRHDLAARDLETLSALDISRKYVPGAALYAAMRVCSWQGFSAKLDAVLRRLDAGEHVITPFPLLCVPSSSQQHLHAAAVYFQDTASEADISAWPARTPGSRIRLGYFSADFTTHATSHLITGLFEMHDRSRFEIFAIATQGSVYDPMRKYIGERVDHLIDASAMSDQEIVALSRKLQIDIAMDLNVYTARHAGFFAHRVAPVQVNYLGYPGTSGASCYDYIIGDRFVTPYEHRPWFSECVVTLPHTYQPNDFRLYSSVRSFSRSELDLPEASFVFCCFNDSSKITPDVFDVWMRLLDRVDDSVLWLLDCGATFIQNLRGEAEKRGVSPDRLIFAPRMPISDHLARHKAADLFLDTFHYNAHTTAVDALWMGLPIVTRLGDAFPGRVAASLLNAAWLPELITESAAEYEELALALATDREALADIRTRLEKNRERCPLFDTARYARNIESAYIEIWKRHEAKLEPADIVVKETQFRAGLTSRI